jgi:hypothetical protein
MHDHTWGTFPAFRRIWPPTLVDAKGELLLDCFEVVDVIPNSPAEGHLQKGDLLLAMDGGVFVTSGALRPDQPAWKFQDTRSLEMDAGERLDLAEGRGRVSFDVLRLPEGQPPSLLAPPEVVAVREAQVGGEMRLDALRELELDVPVKTGEELTLLLELTRKHNGSCAAELIRPRLEGPAGVLDLSNLRRFSQASGWGAIRRSVDNDGREIQYDEKPVTESLWFHAPGHLAWVIPEGFDRFRSTLVCRRNAEGYRARVVLRRPAAELPPQLEEHHQVVAFDIPKIGSYGKRAPDRADAKSAMVARMTAAWLAGQQQPDGSWKRTCGYTHNGYDTAWAALGLLSQADPAYEPHIRKAAEYLAFHCPQDDWTIPASMMVLYLSEYWLRTHDDRILPSLQTQVQRLRGKMLYGDYVSGHGGHPGYRGTGVSTGGSHLALAFAVAAQTPVKGDPRIVDRMLARAQELAPGGFIPYGRSTSERKFEPDLTSGATYSGRHGPYLIASYIHGGPRTFTDNCTAMYAEGEVGGMDQGHACQSMSTNWGLLAAGITSREALERHFYPLQWKLTMLRCHDGGFCQNAYRLEYQGGEGLLPNYLRSGAYLVIYNSEKHNLAITGAPQWRAKSFPDVPPICHDDAMALAYYQRNWGIAAAVLGDQAPPRLKAGLAKLLKLEVGEKTRSELFAFLQSAAAPTARDILKLSEDDPLRKRSLAEMVLGVDLRLEVEPDTKDDNPIPGRWRVKLDVQHPLAGYFLGATDAERDAWRKNPPLPMEGSVEIVGKPPVVLQFTRDFGRDGWHTQHLEAILENGPDKGPAEMKARVRYQVAEMTFRYDRPIVAGGEEPGNGEKGRKLLGDRIVWTPGWLHRDLNSWNASFFLPSGQYISAATQGRAVRVKQGSKSWVAPDAGTLPAGTRCQFGFSSAWQYYEGRVGEIRIGQNDGAVSPKQWTCGSEPLDRQKMQDHDRSTSQTANFPADAAAPLTIEAQLAAPTLVRGIDMRLKDDGRGLRLVVETQENGVWQVQFQGVPSPGLCSFPPVQTQQLRVQLLRERNAGNVVEVQEFHIIGKLKAKKP